MNVRVRQCLDQLWRIRHILVRNVLCRGQVYEWIRLSSLMGRDSPQLHGLSIWLLLHHDVTWTLQERWSSWYQPSCWIRLKVRHRAFLQFLVTKLLHTSFRFTLEWDLSLHALLCRPQSSWQWSDGESVLVWVAGPNEVSKPCALRQVSEAWRSYWCPWT